MHTVEAPRKEVSRGLTLQYTRWGSHTRASFRLPKGKSWERCVLCTRKKYVHTTRDEGRERRGRRRRTYEEDNAARTTSTASVA